jgi:hypothetical protein
MVKYILFLTPKGQYSTCIKSAYEGNKSYQGCKKIFEGTFEQCRKELAKIQSGEPEQPEPPTYIPTPEEIEALIAKMTTEGFDKRKLTAHEKWVLKYIESQKEANNE